MSDIWKQLKEPFEPALIHWRIGATTKDKTKGIGLAYIDARDVMKRLDDVLGVDGWQCRYPYAGCCEIGIVNPATNEWMWKANGAGETDVEGEKGQYSDAFKRAAVMWGVGRYLYYLPNVWVELDSYKRIINPPPLPKWAIPGDKDA